MVEDEYFREFCETLNPSYHMPSRNTIKSKIFSEYHCAFEKVSKIFNEFEGKVALTGDGWSDRLGRGFFVITCHWVSKDWKLQSSILDHMTLKIPQT